MLRFILPVIFVASYFFPWYTVPLEDPISGRVQDTNYTASVFIGDTVDCALAGNLSVSGECAPSGALGFTFLAAFVLAGLAAVVGILAILPILRRPAGFVNLLAGLVGLGAVGWLFTNMMQTDDASLAMGSYAALAVSVLLVIGGAMGMRSDD